FNFAKRTELVDLQGRVALLTGGRVKIGYQAGLKLLRAGARLIVTTRFPRDSAARYSREPDFAEWKDRLEIFGLDLRHTPSVEAFCRQLLQTHDRLDFIVNNACQTVRRPPDFYAHMMEGEKVALSGSQVKLISEIPSSPELSQVKLLPEEYLESKGLFPAGVLDQDLQQVDLRGRNSWRLLLDEVSSVEFLEVQLVNAVAPFVLNARLKPLMLRTPGRDKHIVNVSAVEGQFYRNFKTTRHPHTNMAKAALNMMTRTAAADYHGDGIHMNSVDTGWVTDEDPVELAARKTAEHRFHPPLDIVDGATRIVDPIIDGFNTGRRAVGKGLPMSLLRLSSLALVFLVAGCTHEEFDWKQGEDLLLEKQVKEQPDGSVEMRFVSLVNAPGDDLYKAFIDVEHHDQFIEGVTESKLVSSVGGVKKVVDVTNKVLGRPNLARVEWTIDRDHKAISFRTLEAKFTDNSAEYLVEASPD